MYLEHIGWNSPINNKTATENLTRYTPVRLTMLHAHHLV